jgi:PST family polysaccharide transporter
MNLGRRALTSLFYTGAEQYTTVLIGFIANIILTRLIFPEYFGTLALAWFFASLLQTAKSLNLKAAVIQSKEKIEDVLSTQFVLEISLGLLMILASIPLYFIVSHYYTQDVAYSAVLLILFLFFESFNLTPQAFLEKNLLFKQLAFMNIIPKTLASVIAIALAYHGQNLYSLIVFRGLPSLLTALMLYLRGYWKPRLHFDKKIAISLLKFSSYLWLSQMLAFATLELDDFFVGTIAGLVALGYYSRAYVFARIPTNVFHEGVARVFLPVYSRMQDDRKRLSRAFGMVVGSMTRILTLISLLLVACAPELTNMILGEQWMPAVEIFQLMVVYLLLKPIIDHAEVAFISLGQTKITTKLLLAQSTALVVFVPALTYLYGAAGAAVGINIMTLVGFLLSYKILSKFIDLNHKSVFIPPLTALIGAAAMLYLTLTAVQMQNQIAVIILKSAVVSATYVMILLLIERQRITRMLDYFLKTMFSKSETTG